MKHKNNELKLYSSKANWLTPATHGSEMDEDKRMIEVRSKILARDNHTCHYCGFRSEKYQEIHHINHNHSDFNEDNLTTICPLCHQSFHLSTCSQTKGGIIIWLPEISQVDLNNLCRFIFMAQKCKQDKWNGISRKMFSNLQSRMNFVTNELGAEAHEPIVLAQALLKIPEEKFDPVILSSLRLLPFASRFELELDYWTKNVYGDFAVEGWSKLVPESLNIFDLKNKQIIK